MSAQAYRYGLSSFNLKFLVVFALTLGCITHAAAQGVSINDLPLCAATCAETAATAAGCSLADTTCLCAHPSFTTATIQCANSVCNFEDRSTASGVLRAMCANQTTITSSSTTPPPSSSSSSSISHTPSTSNSVTGSSTSQLSQAPTPSSQSPTAPGPSTVTVTSTNPSMNPTPSGVSAITTPSAGNVLSTVVVVQTVVLPQTSTLSGAVGMRNIGPGVLLTCSFAVVGAVLL
ncbi:hypothetical protein BDZ97DRAFT_1811497 [Flammula alnicola]|nr:hypothetical protein BDZ97DRAFT_1811497 [Flammula alnicola]